MADNTIIRYSGQYIRNATGGTAGGAYLYVYNAGTTTLSSIYTDTGLTVASINPIIADAAGLLPFAYKGTGAYKVILKTSGGTTLDEEDNLPGALDTSTFTAATYAKVDEDVQTKSTDYVMVAGDVGTVINLNTTGTTVQLTLLSAVTVTNGRGVTARHTGTSGQGKILTSASQTITSPKTGVTTTAFSLVGYGESVYLVSDGAGWHVAGYVPPLMTPNTPGVIIITDRVSAAPSSPTPGARYIVSAAYSTFEQEDIIEADGQGGFIEYTPPTDCGWIAYVQDEDANYQFIGSAWAAQLATTSEVATGTSATKSISPASATGYLPGALLGLLEDRQVANTAGGTATASAWTTRALNTETYDRHGILSLSANQFTISAAGTYEIEWEVPFYSSSGTAKSRLYNISDASEVDIGTQGGWGGGTGATQFYSRGVSRVTITASKAFAVQYYASSAISLGLAANVDSKNEIYTRVIIRRG
jgi:hypothetical protein